MNIFNLSKPVFSVLVLVCFTAFILPGKALATEDYLRLLESEASRLELDKAGQRADDNTKQLKRYKRIKQQWLGECRALDDTLPDNLLYEEFPSYLNQCSLSTYSIYRRLDTDLQQTVYETYKRSSSIDFSSLRKVILQYL